MTKDEALRLALEALEIRCGTNAEERGPYGAITAIREALAQPEQEPVAWVHLESWKTGKFWPDDCFSALPIDEWLPLYTTPPHRKPLTDEEIETYRYMIDWTASWSYINFARAIEAAHGIKGEE